LTAVNIVKCKVCKQAEAIIKLENYRLNLCPGCFDDFVVRRVEKGIRHFRMFGHRDRVLVAVSGGKDSLGLWDLLLRLGYRADGFHIDLGIGSYSQESTRLCREFAEQRKLKLYVRSVPEEFGLGIREVARSVRRAPCSICGMLKRHLMNRTALDQGCDVLATGHNLDDEATSLFGNVLHWQEDYLARQFPVLPQVGAGLKRKVKPLIFVGEKEMAAYVTLKGIPYIYEECPMSKGAMSLHYKEILNQLELHSRGTKLFFLKIFLDEQRQRFQKAEDQQPALAPCTTCGTMTTAGLCAACRLREKLAERGAPGGRS